MRKVILFLAVLGVAMGIGISLSDFQVVNFLDYSGQTAEIIGEIKREYGITVSSPTTVEGKKNLPWRQEEIEILKTELELIPSEMMEGVTKIWLYKPEGTSGSPGGLHIEGKRINFYLPADFDLGVSSVPGPEGEIFGGNRELLMQAVVHEFAHNFVYNNPQFYEGWIEEIGWKKENDVWVNPDMSLVTLRSYQQNPNEDFAVSVSILQFGPSYLSDSRMNFLAKNEPFAGWIQGRYAFVATEE